MPKGQAFVWLTRDIIESPAWRAMSQNARLVIDRVCLEHMAHGGGQNGFLPVTYDDFENAGIRRGSIRRAIAEALALGFVEMTQKGTRGWGEFACYQRPDGNPALFNPRFDGVKLMEVQRREHPDAVGAFCQLSTIKPGSVLTEIVAQWSAAA